MSIKGFQIDGAVQKYDYTALDNKPTTDTTLSVSGGFADAAATGVVAAEIEDIRIGADGTVYQSAGEAVREQIKSAAKDGITSSKTHYNDYLFTLGDIDYKFEVMRKPYGYIYMDADVSDFIEINSDHLVIIGKNNTGNISGLYFFVAMFDEDKNHISNASFLNTVIYPDNARVRFAELAEGTKYIRIISDSRAQSANGFEGLEFYAKFPEYPLAGININEEFSDSLIKENGISKFSGYDLSGKIYEFQEYNKALPIKWPVPASSYFVSSVLEVSKDKPLYFRTQNGDMGRNDSYVNNHVWFHLYDSDCNYVEKIQNAGQTENAKKELVKYKNGDYVVTKLTILNEAIKYIRLEHNKNSIPNEQTAVDNMIISYSEPDLFIKKEDYSYYEPTFVNDMKDLSSDTFDDKYSYLDEFYKYDPAGHLTPLPQDYKYVCWGQEMMQHDNANNVFACMMRASKAHGSSSNALYFCTINADTLKSSPLTNINANGVIPTWACGFAINNDNKYLLFGIVGSTRHRFSSTNNGTTWADDGEYVVNDTYSLSDPKKFFSVSKLKSGRLIGVYDDTVVRVNSKNTIIAISDDDGMTWTTKDINGSTTEVGVVEQTFVELDDETIISYGRKNNYTVTNSSYISFSYDNGDNWTKPVSSVIEQGPSDATAFINNFGNVEVFCTKRGTPSNNNYLLHYGATQDEAKENKYTLLDSVLVKTAAAADFTAPCAKMSAKGTVLLAHAYSDPSIGSTPTQWLFWKSKNYIKPANCCDGFASEFLPYSGKKIEELYQELARRITALETN